MLLDLFPLLEVLDMSLNYPLNSPRISIVAPNLKSLSFKLRNAIDQHQVVIDAPKLSYLYVIGGGSSIDFDMDPTVLDTADIDSTYFSFFSMRKGMDANDLFVKYASLCFSMPLFGNLSYARMTLTRSSGINDFLLFLRIAPNLKEVFVTLSYEEGNPLADMTKSAVVVPELLLNNLDYVNITGLQGNNDEVNLVGYIMKSAIGLNHLYIMVYVDNAVEDEDARVGKEFKFCKDYFRLPISSSMIRVVFSGQYVGATNDTATSHNEIVLRL
ncbi:hypothetical protein RDABS01_021473 [Bienertia sinuspersici]